MKNVYISSSCGDDSNDGLSQQTAWKTFENVKSLENTGVSIFLKRGDCWNETLEIKGLSGKEDCVNVLSSYGDGDRPKISRDLNRGEKCVTFENVSHWKVSDLDIGNCGGIGISFIFPDCEPHENITVENCYFHHIYGIDQMHSMEGEKYQFSAGIGVGGGIKNFYIKKCQSYMCGSLTVSITEKGCSQSTRELHQGFFIEDCVCESNTIYGAAISETAGGHIKNCTFKYNGTQNIAVGSTALMLGNLKDYTVSDCEVAYQQRLDFDPDGCGIDFEVSCYDVVVERCNIHHNAGAGVMFYNNSGKLNHRCIVRECNFQSNNQNGYIPSGSEVYFQSPDSNNDGIICDNTFALDEGVLLVNEHDPSVKFINNTERKNAKSAESKDIYRASDSFDFYNGRNGWHYLSLNDSGECSKMKFLPKKFRFSDADKNCIVGPDRFQPDEVKAVKRWIAPRDGEITVLSYGNISRTVNDTNELYVSVCHNGKSIWGPVQVAFDKPVTLPLTLISVKKGDEIDFIADDRSVSGKNTLIWDPVIIYDRKTDAQTPALECNKYRTKYNLAWENTCLQGGNYMYYLHDESLMTWSDRRNRYESEDAFVSANIMYAKVGAVKRLWQAPRGGRIRVNIGDIGLRSIGEGNTAVARLLINDSEIKKWEIGSGKTEKTEVLFFDIDRNDKVVFEAKAEANRGISVIVWSPAISYVQAVETDKFKAPVSGNVSLSLKSSAEKTNEDANIRILKNSLEIRSVSGSELSSGVSFDFYMAQGEELTFITKDCEIGRDIKALIG